MHCAQGCSLLAPVSCPAVRLRHRTPAPFDSACMLLPHTPHALALRPSAVPDDVYLGIESGQGAVDDSQVDDKYDGPNMVPLDTDSAGGLGGTSEEVFGPTAALLVGFTQEEFEAFRAVMIDMDADFVKMMACSPAMLDGTLEEAMTGPAPQYEPLPEGTRRAVLLSGMYTGEVMEVIGVWRDTDSLPETLWGAAVPRNWDRNLSSLIDEMYEDQAFTREQERLYNENR